ncbi:hypothetical protein ABL78_6899 [Leptomonas seymouri]|uniref:Uncharacterized protein n=1 Tax=Leptomonas seymouri TaxID=5684 RepID=A0A0N1PA38_LEPSE|nr:hypothetical protein ABL78_6899 [Leptomonas seymouri]|eukprot:KPI84054.1 hypothetical protein ABL78_6899 [Leptomonas seymouri]
MQTAAPSSSAAYGSGGHWSDSGTHTGGHADPCDGNAAAASDVFRDFTWYSAMLLSHLFSLEYAHRLRDAAVEEQRRNAASAQSPQLLLRAAMAAVNTPTTTTAQRAFTALPVNFSDEDGSSTAGDTGAVQTLPHLTTQHRPHIFLGFTINGTASGHAHGSGDDFLNDPSTLWTAPGRQNGVKNGATITTDDSKTAALLAAFDAFYFPLELFPSSTKASGTPAEASNRTTPACCTAPAGALGGDCVPRMTEGGNEDGGMNRTGAIETAGSAAAVAEGNIAAGAGSSASGGAAVGAAGPAGGPLVTPEVVREAFHTLLLLGQRCAAFALMFHGIIGASAADEDAGEDTAMTMSHSVVNTGFSSEDEGHNSSAAGRTLRADSAAMQQAASASLQFMLQLACSCPCEPLSYAAQLCLAHALAVQPPPRSVAGRAARKQLLCFLPTFQPPSRASTTDATAADAATSSGPPMNAVGGNAGSRVPATQYVRAEDPMLWFDATGAVHVTTAQRWWEGQQRARGTSLCAYCGPLPATTALPTVQRLLMEEDQYRGPNGSAAAVLQSVLEAVSTEVTRNARAIPGSSSSLVHTSLRRRRGTHGGGGSASINSSTGSPSGGQQAATVGPMHGALPNPSDTTLDVASGSSDGSAMLPQPPTEGSNSSHSTADAGTSVARMQGSPATSSSRLSKAAKRRRALLFALAQSHLLPPSLQLGTSKTLLYGIFTDSGECPSYYMLLSLYPGILRAHHASLHYVLFEDGPLPVDVRLMVATMAASRHRCEYLVSRFSALLLRYAEEAMLEEGDDDGVLGDQMDNYDAVYHGCGGVSGGRHGVHSFLQDPHQLDADDVAGGYHGMHSAPPPPQQLPCRGQARLRWITDGPPARLRAVQRLIAIAAHTPWTLSEGDIRNALAGGWTIPEVFQLVAIVVQVVPLCSFVMGLFVPAEPWTMALVPLEVVERLGHRAVMEEAAAGGVPGGGGGGAYAGSGGGATASGGTLSGLRRMPNTLGDAMPGACPGPATPHQASSSRTLLGMAMSGNDTTMAGSGNSGSASSSAACNASVDIYRRYAGEDSIVSEQRIKGSNATANPHTLWRSQFTWNEVGATSMEQYYPGAATLMSEEIECFFDVVRQLTKADCVGLMSPDYAPSYAFRSLQLYVQNLLGFMVEDYPYNDINKVLRRPAKWFAQVLTMRPETLTRSEVVRWYVPTTPPIGKSSDLSAESSLVTHQLKREIELLSVVDSARGGHRGGIESASAHPESFDNPPPTPAEAAWDAAEAEALQTALTLQDERVLLLIALATMEARKEGLLHILLRPVCSVLSNM